MHQHKQRYFNARDRRPSPAIKWHYAVRKNTLLRNLAGCARRPRPGQRRQEAVPAERAPAARQDSLHAPQYARRHGLAAASCELRQYAPRLGSGAYHTAPCCGRRCAAMLSTMASATLRGPSPTPAMTHGGSAARSARPQRGQPPSRACSRNRPGPRKGTERRAGIRNPSALTQQDVGAR
jgi:hypothetical protein